MVNPIVGPFHVLLQIALALARISTMRVLAIKFMRYRAVFIVEVAVSLLFRRPSVLVVLAVYLTAFPRARMGLLVLTIIWISILRP